MRSDLNAENGNVAGFDSDKSFDEWQEDQYDSGESYFQLGAGDLRPISRKSLLSSLFGNLQTPMAQALTQSSSIAHSRCGSPTDSLEHRLSRYTGNEDYMVTPAEALLANAMGQHNIVRKYLTQPYSDKTIKTTSGVTLLMQVYQTQYNHIPVEDPDLAFLADYYHNIDATRYGSLSFAFIDNADARQAWAVELIDAGTPVDGTGEIDDYCNCTALHAAIAYGDQAVVKKILAAPDCDPNAEAHDNRAHHPIGNKHLFEYISPLLVAARMKNHAAIASLLSHPRIALETRLGHAPDKELVIHSVDIPALREFNARFPSIGAFHKTIADLNADQRDEINSDPRQKGRGSWRVLANSFFSSTHLLAESGHAPLLSRLYAAGLMPPANISTYPHSVQAISRYAHAIRNLKGITPLLKDVYAMPDTPAMRATLLDRLNHVDQQFVSTVKRTEATRRLIAQLRQARIPDETGSVAAMAFSTRTLQVADTASINEMGVDTAAGAQSALSKLNRKRGRDGHQTMKVRDTSVAYFNSSVPGHLGGCYVYSFGKGQGSYNAICRNLTILCGGNKNEKTKAVASYLLSLTRSKEDTSILRSAGIPSTRANLDLLRHVYVLFFIKEISRRYNTGARPDGTIPARLPFGICQIFSIKLIENGTLGLRDVFSNDAHYGLPTGAGVTSSNLTASINKVMKITQTFMWRVILPHYGNDPRISILKHNQALGLLTLSSEYLHQHILLKHYGGESESDGANYTAPGSPRINARGLSSLFLRTSSKATKPDMPAL